MALKATIFKAGLQNADMERNYYHDHALTIARHPSETDERMMVRLLAFALHAGPDLLFGKGLSTDDEPDLWHKDVGGTGNADKPRDRNALRPRPGYHRFDLVQAAAHWRGRLSEFSHRKKKTTCRNSRGKIDPIR